MSMNISLYLGSLVAPYSLGKLIDWKPRTPLIRALECVNIVSLLAREIN